MQYVPPAPGETTDNIIRSVHQELWNLSSWLNGNGQMGEIDKIHSEIDAVKTLQDDKIALLKAWQDERSGAGAGVQRALSIILALAAIVISAIALTKHP